MADRFDEIFGAPQPDRFDSIFGPAGNPDFLADPLKKKGPTPLLDAVSGKPERTETPSLQETALSGPAPGPQGLRKLKDRQEKEQQEQQAQIDQTRAEDQSLFEGTSDAFKAIGNVALGAKHGWDSTLAAMRGNRADFQIATTGPTKELLDASEQAKKEAEFAQESAPDGVASQIGQTLAMLPASMFSSGKQAVKAGAAGAAVGAAGGAAGGPLGAVAGAVSGGGTGLAAGFIADSFVTNTGQIVGDLRDAGLDDDNAKAWGYLGGSIMAALDLTGIGFAARPFVKAAEKKAVTSLVEEELKKQLAQSPVREAVKDYFIAAGGETAAETAQQIVQDVTTDLAKQGSGEDFKTIFNDPERRKQVVENAVQTAVATFAGMAVLGVPGAAVSGVRVRGERARAADALFGQPQPFEQEMARGAPLVTPEDQASPLPTDLIQQGKGTVELDLENPGRTKLPEGGTIGEAVDAALGPAPDLQFDIPEEALKYANSNPAHQATPDMMDKRVAGLRQDLVSRGINPDIADGIAAGIIAEAGGDHTALNKDSGAYGLGQWLGSRKAELFKRYGPNPTRSEQLDFLVHELNGGDQGGAAVLSSNNPAEALDNYVRKFMRPAAGAETEGDLKRGAAALGGAAAGMTSVAPQDEEQSAEKPDIQFTEQALPEPQQEREADDFQPFDEALGTLGIPRSEMPQIKGEDRSAMVQFLRARGVDYEEHTTRPEYLKPTQAEFSPRKVEDALGIMERNQGGDRALLVSSDGYVLDGHHQWVAALRKGGYVRMIQLNAPIRELLPLAHEFPSSTKSSESRTEAQPTPQFDAEAFDRERDERIAASKAAGNQHLDDLEPAVETMRGKKIYYAHDPNVTGTVRTVANTGEVVVHWNDAYSAEKEMATAKTEGGKEVQESWLQPSDLKDYVVGTPAQSQLKAKIAAKREEGGFDREFAKQDGLSVVDANMQVNRKYSREEQQAFRTGAWDVAGRPSGWKNLVADPERAQAIIEDEHLAKIYTAGRKAMSEELTRREKAHAAKAEEAPAEKPFEPLDHIPAMKKLVAETNISLGDLNAVAKRLGVTPDQAHKVLGQLAAMPNSGIRQTKGRPETRDKRGKVKKKAVPPRFIRETKRKTPLHLMEVVRQLGGVQSGAHDLRNVGAIARFPGVINNKSGMSLDDLGLALKERGFFTERPSEDDVLQLLSEGSRRRIYSHEDVADAQEREAAQDNEQWEDYHRGELEALASDFDLALKKEEFDTALDYVARGESHEYALSTVIREHAVRLLDEDTERLDDSFYRDNAHDLYQGDFPEQRGEGPAESQPQGQADEGAAGRQGEDREQSGQAGRPEQVSTAPEHATVGVDDRELHEIVVEYEQVRASQGEGDEQITHIFDPPAKSEIVRLNERTRVYHKDHGWMSVEEARKRIREWEQHAVDQGRDPKTRSANGDKIVLSFFDLSGEWSAPWDQAGYQVWRFDIQNDPAETPAEEKMGDVNNFSSEFFSDWFGDFEGKDVYAILSANPCTDFAVSGARHFAAKDKDGRTVASVRLVQQTLAAIEYFKPAVWAIENPVGRIEKLGGLPPWRLSFDPNDVGETYTKKTLIWGRFNADLPIAPVEPVEGSKMHKQYGGKSLKTKNARSVTPEGFAYSFFMANNAVDHPAMAVANKYDRLDRKAIEQAVARGVTEEQIDDAVQDFYYQDLDDAAANEAIRQLQPEGKPPASEKAKPQEAPEDVLGPRSTDTRDHLQRKADEGLKPKVDQKPVGSDGGLFDTQDTTGDLFQQGASKTVTPSDPVEKAKATLQQALDELNGTEKVTQPESTPEPTPEERGMKPLFDSEEPGKQVGFFDEKTGKTELTDVGEKIGGARKDMFAERGLQLSDLENMSRGEAHQLVTKENVWPKPDYAKLVEEGVEPEAAAAQKLLRDQLAAKPKVDSDEGRQDYIEAMQVARQVLADTKTAADVRGVQTRLYNALGVSTDYIHRQSDEQKLARRKLFSIFKGTRAHFSIDYKMRRKIEQMLEQGWPQEKAEAWTRRFTVRESYREKGKWAVTDKQRRTQADGLESKEAAQAKARELYEALTKNEDGTKKTPDRPHLDQLERTGADIRNGRDIKPEDFLSDFGFRGVEFGNWVANDERQKAVNLAYEGLHDLADTLGIPPETLSLGGQLGLAFGARGKGSAAAHYEPGKLVINLTKLKGAGTLAHEWGHALDHYFGSLDSELGTRGAPTYASGGRGIYNFKALGNLRPELAQAFDGVMQALFSKEKSRAEAIRGVELRIEQVQAGIERQQKQIESYRNRPEGQGSEAYAKAFIKKSEDWIATQRDVVLHGLGKRLAELRDEKVQVKLPKVESSFYQNAQLLSGKAGARGYWARPTELFARTFEAYVFDKIAERGNKSQYLVQGVEEDRYASDRYAGNPYPTGKEREAITAAYDKLFETVEVRGIPAPREGGPTKALGQAGDLTTAPFYSALERGIENSTTKRAPAQQWLATLSKTPGVKAEELEWSGVEDWLKVQEGPVEREALLGVIRDQGIKVDEVVLGRTDAEKLADYGYDPTDLLDLIANENETQFSSWSSDPANPTYRELLITLPLGEGGNPDRAPSTHWDTEAVVAHTRFMEKTDADGKRVLFVEEIQSDWHQKGRDQGYGTKASKEELERLDAAHAEADKAYIDSIVRSVEAGFDFLKRFKGRSVNAEHQVEGLTKHRQTYGSDATYRYLSRAVDETISEARREGFLTDADREAYSKWLTESKELNERTLAVNEARQALDNARGMNGIPDAPFKSTWPALVMKRLIRWAVDNGFDKIAWTTGSEQAERYNLSKQLGTLGVALNDEGDYWVDSSAHQLRHLIPSEDFLRDGVNGSVVMTGPQVLKIFGNDLGKRMIAAADKAGIDQTVHISGEDLKLGGEGMKAFYDRNLVNITNDIIKKYGGKVETVGIAARADAMSRSGKTAAAYEASIAAAQQMVDDPNTPSWERERWERQLTDQKMRLAMLREASTNPGFEITDKLREAAASGLPLFRRGAGMIRLSPEQEAELQAGLKAQLDKMIPGDRIALHAASGLKLAKDGFMGQYWNRVITVALDRADMPFTTLAHETWHAVGPEGISLVTKTEYNLVNERGWNDPAIRAHVQQHYGSEPLAVQKEEAGAFWIQSSWDARNHPQTLNRIIYRIGRFLGALKNALLSVFGKGGMTARDVADKLFSGEIGQRPEGFGDTVRGRRPTVTFGRKTYSSNAPAGQAGYHGTPHDFDEFSTKHIGSGEGAQVYGWGLYFAGKKQVAEFYKESLSRGSGFWTIKGQQKAWGDAFDAIFNTVEKDAEVPKSALQKIVSEIMDGIEAGDNLDTFKAFVRRSDWDAETKAAYVSAIDASYTKNVNFRRAKGRLFEVEIPDDHEYLAWDKPLTDQPPHVKEALQRLGFETDEDTREVTYRITGWVPEHTTAIAPITVHLEWGDGQPSNEVARFEPFNKGTDYHVYINRQYRGSVGKRIVMDEANRVGREKAAEATRAVRRDPMTGKDAYHQLAHRMRSERAPRSDDIAEQVRLNQRFNAPREASLALLAEGVPGIRYLDGGSRSAGDGTYNYVVFDDQQIQVKAKYQKAAPVTVSNARPERLIAPVRAVLDAFGGKPSEALGEALDNLRTIIQDRMLPVLRTQASVEMMLGRKIADDENPYLQEELFHGRTGARLDELAHKHVEPLFEAMKEAKVSPDELEAFLYARHAPERNKRMSEINPAFQPGTGSGMTDEEAAAIMREADEAGLRDVLEGLAGQVDAMLKDALDTRVQAGLLSKDEADVWRKTYRYYVPLRGLQGDEEIEGNIARINRQSGMSVRGKESRRAFGRKTKAQDILAYAILQSEEAIVRAEQNEVAKALGVLAKAAPDESFWKVDKIRRVPVFNKSTGQVSYRSESRIAAEDAPFTVSYKVDGTEHRVTFNRNNEAAVRTAAAMRNLNIQQYKFIVGTLGRINRFLSAINTTYNPEFVISNAFRDLQTAGINLAGVDVKGLELRVLKDYPAALKAATKGAFGKESGDWGKWYHEFRFEGGQTAFNDMRDIADLRRDITRAAKNAHSRFGALNFLRNGIKAIDRLNNGVENALRLATYKNAVELGVSKKQAASLAKNVTVNFNRKGTAGPFINSLYLFFNASMQGSARIFQAMRSKKVRRIIYGAIAAGFALQLLNSMGSDEDDDGEKFYDKVPEFEKQRNIIIMLEGGRYAKIPMPWGYNVFPNLGRMLARLWQGERPMVAMGDWASGVIDAFNPVGGADSLLNVISPTIADPIVDLTRNRDYAGRPIMPDEKQFGPQQPDNQRYWASVPPYDKAVTDFLNQATGGDNVRPGFIDVSPETLDYLQQTVFGAAGNFVRNLTSLGAKGIQALNGESPEIEKNDIPLYRKVVGDKPGWYDKAAFYSRLAEVEQQVAFGKQYIKEGNREGLQKLFADESDVLSLEKAAKAARKEMRGTRKVEGQLSNAVAKGEVTDAQAKEVRAKLDDKEKATIDAFNRIYLQTVEKPIRP